MTMRVERKLAAYKAKAAKGYNAESKTWQYHARQAWKPSADGNWQRVEDMPRFASACDRNYYADTWPSWVRDVTPQNKLLRGYHSHNGWYIDDDQNDTVNGQVLRVRGKNRKPCFIPGLLWSGSDGVTLRPLDMYDDETDCARAADGWAEHVAEEGREYQEEETRKSRIYKARQDIITIRIDIRALVREIKRASLAGMPAICGALRDRIRSLREKSAKAYATIRESES